MEPLTVSAHRGPGLPPEPAADGEEEQGQEDDGSTNAIAAGPESGTMSVMLSRDEILEKLAENRERIRGFGVRSLAVFGSAVRDEAGEGSDLDFLVEFDQKTFDNYMGLKEFLEELFSCRVDLVIRSALKPRLRATVLAEAVHAPGL